MPIIGTRVHLLSIMNNGYYMFRVVGSILLTGYGIVQAFTNPHRYASGLGFAGLGSYHLWRNWRLLKDPSLRATQRFTLTHVLLFWGAVLLAGVLLWWAVQAR